MKAQKITKVAGKVFVGFSILSIGFVSITSMLDPIATMELVNTSLPNNDAISSIRGIYGGVGLVITGWLVYLLMKELPKALIFLTLFWGAYAISRLITMVVDGPLGDFGNQWLVIESSLCLIGVVIVGLGMRYK